MNKMKGFNIFLSCSLKIILLMTSKQNSFRLGRLSHTSDFRKHSISEYTNNPKETFKLAALTSITHGVKYNDLSFITGRELPKLRKQPQENGDNLEYGAAHQNLTVIRKKYDTVNKQKLQYEAKINLLKEEKEKYKTIEDQYQGNKNQGNDKVKTMEDQLNRMKLQFQETQWNKKVLQMCAERIKHDKIVYDQRKFDLGKELQHLRKQLKIFVKEGTGIHEETDRTSKVYDKLMKQLQAEEAEREAHLQSLANMIGQKMLVNQSNDARKCEIEEIALKAMQDKDENEKNWLKILQAHKLVDNLLRSKMYNEMKKFSTVEMAFKNIKIATGVSDAQELISKFLNKEQAYGELLSKIAENQKRISDLKEEQQDLLKERKGLKEQRQQYLFVKREEVNLHDELKQYEELSQREVNAELHTQKMKNWIVKNLKKVYNIEKTSEDAIVGKTLTELAASFKKYLEVISKEIEKCETGEIKLQKRTSEEEIRPDSKMFRVKPKTKKLNYSGEEIENEFEQEDINNLNEQQELIQGQRGEVLKQNEKFMKDLKRKMEEMKKLKIEADSKQQKAATSPEKKPAKVEQ